MADADCIFCKIVAGKAAAEKLFEDEEMIVIPDVSPAAPVHLLCISKSHGEELANVDMPKLMRLLTRVKAEIIARKLDSVGYRVAINGVGATLVKDHLHIHILGGVSHERPV